MLYALTKKNSPQPLHLYLPEINSLLGIYIRVMELKREREYLSKPKLISAYLYLAYGYLRDVGFNWWTGTKLFKDLPREFTFTARLKRYRERNDEKAAIAEFFCDFVLDQHDPDGEHC